MKPTAHNSQGCTEIQAQLPLYVGGDLESPVEDVSASDLARAEAVERALTEPIRRHLAGCSVCTGELTRLQAALNAIGALRNERLREIDVWDKVRTGLVEARLIAGEPSSTTLAQPRLAPAGNTTRWGFGRRVAASIALVGIGMTAWWVARDRASDVPSVVDGDAIEHGTRIQRGAGAELASGDPSVAPALEQVGIAPLLVSNPALDGRAQGGLRKVNAEETELWRQAQPFGAPAAARAVRDGWQAASYSVRDPRVR